MKQLQFTTAPELNATQAAPQWINLAPFGEHRTRDGLRVQVLDEASALELVDMFNFWPRRVMRLMEINGVVPVWLGHPDFAPQEWPDKLKLGDVRELSARDGALWGRVEWNADGLRILSEGEHRFPSVAWEVVYDAARRGKPINLWSVGVWRSPNIKDTPPIVAAELNSATNEPETSNQESGTNNQEQKTTMKELILALLVKLGLIEETPADETAALATLETTLSELQTSAAQLAAIMEALAPLNAALSLSDKTPLETIAAATAAIEAANGNAAEINTVREEINTVRGEITALRESRVEIALNAALAAGAVTKAGLQAAREKLTAAADFNAALTELNAATPRLNMQPLTLPRAARTAATSAHEQRAEINAWIEAKMAEAKISYDAAFTLAKAEFPDHFKKHS